MALIQKTCKNLAKAHFNQVTSDIRLSKNSQEVIKAQQEEINRLICSYSPSEKALFYDIYHDQIKDCQTSMTLKTAPNSARPKSMYNVIGLTLILFLDWHFSCLDVDRKIMEIHRTQTQMQLCPLKRYIHQHNYAA